MGITVGETRWPGFIMLTIPDLSSIRARVMVLESDSGSLRVGQKAEIIVDSHPGQRFPATVSRIETLARSLDKDSPVKYFEVTLSLTGSSHDVLRPGKLVRAEITIAEYDRILTVPRFAIVQEGAHTFVFIGKEKRPVQLDTGDRATAVIRSGLRSGESVVLNPGEEPQGQDALTNVIKQPRTSQAP
jgi:multidrug efflux pump subunit AcrA (membrane-fusion protein)